MDFYVLVTGKMGLVMSFQMDHFQNCCFHHWGLAGLTLRHGFLTKLKQGIFDVNHAVIVAFDFNISVFSDFCMKCIDNKAFTYLSWAGVMPFVYQVWSSSQISFCEIGQVSSKETCHIIWMDF